MKSEYELERDARIERNRRVLESLGLASAAAATRAPVTPKRKRQRSEAPSGPPRRSSRKVTAPGDPLDDAKRWMKRHGFGDEEAVEPAPPPIKVEAAAEARPAAAPRPRGPRPPSASGQPERFEDLESHEHAAFFALREWKRARARELGYNNPCVIAHNRSLCAVVRALPRSPEDLATLWGFGASRVEQHGAGVLAALEPFRAALEAKSPRAVANDGEGAPHRAWLRVASGTGLPVHVGSWDERRPWCAKTFGCRACAEKPPSASWGPSSQKVLDELARRYGSGDAAARAGWRWHARPNIAAYSHDHKWWPPQQLGEDIDDAALPMSTTAALAFLRAR